MISYLIAHFKFQSSEDAWGHANISRLAEAIASRKMFQSSEDAWGHANQEALMAAKYGLTPVSIIRRCVGTCQLPEGVGLDDVAKVFQSSEDAWGHANVERPSLLAIGKEVSIIRRCVGTCQHAHQRLAETKS